MGPGYGCSVVVAMAVSVALAVALAVDIVLVYPCLPLFLFSCIGGEGGREPTW